MGQKLWKMIAVVGIALGIVVTLSVCGSETAKTNSKVLVVGTNATYPPFEFTTDDGKEIQGFDKDLMEAVGKKLDLTVQWKNMPFDGLIPALQAKQIDVIIAGMNATEERKKAVHFTEPYFNTKSVVVTLKDSDIHKEADLKGHVAGAQIGTVEAKLIHSMPGVMAKELNTVPDGLNALKAKAIDALAVDGPVAAFYAKKSPDTFVAFPTSIQSEPVAMAVNKENAKLVEDINKALAELKQDGTYDALYQKWFGGLDSH